MVDSTTTVILIGEKDGKEIQVDERLIEFSSDLKGAPEKDKILCKEINSTDLKIISDYYELYKWNEDKEFINDPKFEEKIKSNRLADCIPDKTLKFIRDQGWMKDLAQGQKPEEQEVDEFKMRDTLEAALLLNFKDFHDILLKAIGVKFWCDATEEAIKAYCVKHELDENVDPQEMYRMMTTEYPEVFDRINQEWCRALEEANKNLQKS